MSGSLFISIEIEIFTCSYSGANIQSLLQLGLKPAIEFLSHQYISYNRVVSNTQLSDLIDEEGPDWHRRQNAYFRFLTISHKPAKVPYFWVWKLQYLPGVRSVSIQLNKQAEQDQLKQINRITARKRLENGLKSCISVVKKARNKLLKEISNDSANIVSDEESFDVSVYIELVAGSKEQLEWCTELVTKAAEEQGVTLTTIQHNHKEAIQSCAPVCNDQLDIKYNMSSQATAATSFIFFEPDEEPKDNYS